MNFSSSSTNGDLETLARAAQILHSITSCREFTKKFEEKSLQFIQKRQILDGETLTRATQSDAERELQHNCLMERMIENCILKTNIFYSVTLALSPWFWYFFRFSPLRYLKNF